MYLRELAWLHVCRIEVHQGDDMVQPLRLYAEVSDLAGAGDFDEHGSFDWQPTTVNQGNYRLSQRHEGTSSFP
jgi:hypothetical protein